MKLNTLLEKGISEVTKDCGVTKISPIADEYGNIMKIIIEYVPKDNAALINPNKGVVR